MKTFKDFQEAMRYMMDNYTTGDDGYLDAIANLVYNGICKINDNIIVYDPFGILD